MIHSAVIDPYTAGLYALLGDGTCLRIRAARPGDWRAVHGFGQALGSESVYRRFHGHPKHPGRLLANAVCTPDLGTDPPARGSLLALLDQRIVGLAQWLREQDPDTAEIALAVADDQRRRGIALLLAEHLRAHAALHGVHRLTALVQGDNHALFTLVDALGIQAGRTWQDDAYVLSVDPDATPPALRAVRECQARREHAAANASLRRLLAPTAIAILGDPRDAATRTVLANLRTFPGPVTMGGADGADLPTDLAADLAVITSPPPLASRAAQACARHGARCAIVTADRFDRDTGRSLLAACRLGGMRLLGPASLGVICAGDRGRFNASLLPAPPAGHGTALVVQSRTLGRALLNDITRLGVGVGCFADAGDKYDVGATDLLAHVDDDPDIRLVLLQISSLAVPRAFARAARRVSRRIPVLALDAHAAHSPLRTALYSQAGVATVASVHTLVDTAVLLAHQPAPRAGRIALLADTDSLADLVAGTCRDAGLDIVATVVDHDLHRLCTARYASGDALVIAVSPGADHPDAGTPPTDSPGDRVPVVMVVPGQRESLTTRPHPDGIFVPCYRDPTRAAAALATAWSTTRLRTRNDTPLCTAPQTDLRAIADALAHCAVGVCQGTALSPRERAALADILSTSLPDPTPASHAPGVTLAVITWRDPLFGPALSCIADTDPARTATMLIPAGAGELRRLAATVLGAQTGGQMELIAHIAALADAFPPLCYARYTITADPHDALRGRCHDATVTALCPPEPLARRLRPAPVD
jgi:succinyl-CoA synthetase alpha subunit/GNAT superfamily N-acetyltransferase